MKNDKFKAWLLTPGIADGGDCIECKFFDDGFYAGVKRLLFHYTMIVGQIGDQCGYEKRYCYQTREGALKALTDWDGTGEPVGWHRSPETGRRRPDGDPTKEYIEA